MNTYGDSSLDNNRKLSTSVFRPILNVRQDDLSGLDPENYGHRDPFFQFFKPVEDDVDLGADRFIGFGRVRREDRRERARRRGERAKGEERVH